MKQRERRDDGIGLEALMDWAVIFCGACLAGIAIYLALRLTGLRWTWTVPLLGVVPLVWTVDPRLGLAVGISAIGATAIGIGWHQQDIERRRVEAQRARDRVGPLMLMRSQLARRRARSNRVDGDRFALGSSRSGEVVTVPFGSRQGVRLMVIGSPGSGKTITAAAISGAYADVPMPVFSIDPKGDPAAREELIECADRSGVKFLEWSPDGPAIYNPFGRGDSTEVADKALSGEQWSEPHYLRQAQRYLGWAVRAMREADVTVSLRSLARYTDPALLEALSDRCETEKMAQGLRTYLDSLSQRQRADLGGVRDRLAILAESQLGRWLDPDAGGEVIDLSRAWRERSIVYFRLDSDRYPLASQMLAAAIVSDIVSLTGELQREASFGLVAIDEFAAVGARDVLRVLSRSRSAGISVVLATQGLADLDDAGTGTEGGGFAKRVLTQLDCVIAHRQPESESAETLATMSGTRPIWVTTRRIDSRLHDPKDSTGSRTREREFVCHPDEFKGLSTGEAIVIEPARRSGKRINVWRSSRKVS